MEANADHLEIYLLFHHWSSQIGAIAELVQVKLPQKYHTIQDEIGSYGYDNHGCFKASEADGRFFGFTSRR